MKKVFCALLCASLLIYAFTPPVFAESAAAFAVINGDTGELIYAKNSDLRLAMASTTKIMTALLLCEAFDDLEKTVTVNEQAVAVEGTSMGLKAGDKVKLSDLLYGMLLASGNDAANAAAYAVSGSITAFVDLMNKKAAALGLENTSFATPSGLDGSGHFTTAHDLALLAMYALRDERIENACAQKTAVVEYGDPPQKRTLKNHNRLLFMYDDIVGVKTGYTKKAGRCLVSAARRDGKYIITATLNDKNDWADHRALTDTGYSLLENGACMTEAAEISLSSACGKSVAVELPGYRYYSVSDTPVVRKVFLPGMVYAPIKKGQTVGFAEYYYEYRQVKRISLTAKEELKPEEYSTAQKMKVFFKLAITSSVKV